MRPLPIFAATLLSMLATLPATAIQVTTSSYVVAPNCCGSANVTVVNVVTVQTPEPFWFNQTFSHLWYASVGGCDGTFNNFLEICCIRSGNFHRRNSAWNDTPCPVYAKGRSYGWLGGGSLPYHEHQSESVCTQPCTSCAPVGEDCDYWSDPFCDDPWGPY
jgi:hypothetical protein